MFVRVFLLMTQDENGSKLDSNFQRQFPIQLDIFDATRECLTLILRLPTLEAMSRKTNFSNTR